VPEPVVGHDIKLASSLSAPKTALASRIQPSGLRGFREATTKPATPTAAENQNGDEPPLEFRLWCARRANSGSAMTRASSRPPATSAVVGEASRKRRAASFAVIATWP
jgi:hypothetical protein